MAGGEGPTGNIRLECLAKITGKIGKERLLGLLGRKGGLLPSEGSALVNELATRRRKTTVELRADG